MKIITKEFIFDHLERSDVKKIHTHTSNYSNIGTYWTTHIRHRTYWEKRWDETGLWNDDFGMLGIYNHSNKMIGIIWFFQGLKYCEGLEIGWNFFDKPTGDFLNKVVRVFVAYLFSTYNIPRIQCNTLISDVSKMDDFLEYTDFVHEGTMRKAMYVRSNLVDLQLFSVLTEKYKTLEDELKLI